MAKSFRKNWEDESEVSSERKHTAHNQRRNAAKDKRRYLNSFDKEDAKFERFP